jgi:hypothetical protein
VLLPNKLSRVSNRYFDLRYSSGFGTLHVFCKDQSVLDRLNRLVDLIRQGLPPEGCGAQASFWQQYGCTEKFDLVFSVAVRKLP